MDKEKKKNLWQERPLNIDVMSRSLMPRTGETNETSAVYRFAGFVDGSTDCTPTQEEREIPLSKGERFPPIKSCGKACNWTYVRDA